MISIAVGYPAEVPTPMITRAIVSIPRLSATVPKIPPSSTSPMPVRKILRGPNSAASFPIVGCAIALATYRPATSAAVRPGET